jgi:hypothetical protein
VIHPVLGTLAQQDTKARLPSLLSLMRGSELGWAESSLEKPFPHLTSLRCPVRSKGMTYPHTAAKENVLEMCLVKVYSRMERWWV